MSPVLCTLFLQVEILCSGIERRARGEEGYPLLIFKRESLLLEAKPLA